MSSPPISHLVGTMTLRLESDQDVRVEQLDDWGESGPLPIDWFGHATDARLRASYLDFRAASLLYGQPEPDEPDGGVALTSQRRHLAVRSSIPSIRNDTELATIHVLAIELLGFDSGPLTDPVRTTTFGILHLQVDGVDPVSALNEWFSPAPGAESTSKMSGCIPGLFGADWHAVGRGEREASVFLLTSPEGSASSARQSPPWSPQEAAMPWTTTELELYLTASLTPIAQMPPDTDDPSLLDNVIYLSKTWRALALRDGVGFVGMVPDDGSEPFYEHNACPLVRTVYTDIALLAHLQRTELTSIADDLSRVYRRRDRGSELKSLVARATTIRNQLWWDDVSSSGTANALLRACQDQLGTQRLFERVMQDLDSFRSEVDSEQLERTRLNQESFDRLIKRAGAGFAGASLVLGLLGVNLAGWTSDTGISPALALIGSLGIGLAAIGIAWLLTRNHDSA